MRRRTAAFFDVDGTVINVTSMFRFLEFRLAAEGHPPSAYRYERQRLKAMTAAGVPRAETNRAYFASYAGADVRAIAALAEEWFRAELDRGDFFNEQVVETLRAHQRAGDLIVLVSGSFRGCLAPIARYLDADIVVCSDPATAHGRYTGRVERPMIGEAKAEAVRTLTTTARLDLTASTSYGDHSSDLPLLRLTGRAVVVGEDPEMREQARRYGWTVWPRLHPAQDSQLAHSRRPRS
ncbi:HAD-IB family hydrolase [Streptomyces cinnabarinus]|uniref:HAD-IB family hydrolase n=1 Tax=Streptomyces cinnabarinus TaxID=67287 RepID=A0ABY7KE17_9ACTN|nr:HAD-IB family hydrolase [Streptomyces cinnabarinus]WAZ22770.1 HAD-IB family hydrolase [Streptomyces cinnabarinus]